MTSGQLGDIGVARACDRFVRMGYCVLLPLHDDMPYDLAIDLLDGSQPKRVQVKYTSSTYRMTTPGYYIHFQRQVGGKRRSITKALDAGFDLAFVADADGNDWLIPRDEMSDKMKLDPTGKNARFLLG